MKMDEIYLSFIPYFELNDKYIPKNLNVYLNYGGDFKLKRCKLS